MLCHSPTIRNLMLVDLEKRQFRIDGSLYPASRHVCAMLLNTKDQPFVHGMSWH